MIETPATYELENGECLIGYGTLWVRHGAPDPVTGKRRASSVNREEALRMIGGERERRAPEVAELRERTDDL